MCTTKTCTLCCFGVSTSISSSKSPSPAWEEISEAEVETGLAKIHASTRGKAVIQCCFLHCPARALASIKDRLSLAHCFRVQPSQVVQGFTLHSPAANRHCGHEAWLRERTWHVCNAHTNWPCFLQGKTILAGKRAQNNIQ